LSVDRDGLFIGGSWVKPSTSKRFTVLNATTEEVLGSVPEATEADVDWAVATARDCFEDSEWASLSPADRAAAMHRFADELEKRAADLTTTVSQENGMPIGLSEALST
jgi:acyl-CoA reductase-like NAD-dependent aldehyde dehydrogenase